MKKNDKVILDGQNLTVEDIEDVVRDPNVKIEIPDSAYDFAEKSRTYLEKQHDGKVIYGVNTGFGPMASHVINHGQLETLQLNLIRGHAVGIGKSIKDEYVLAAMIIRLNTLVKGYSAVSRDLLDLLALFINKRIIPIVPEHGAVGTSGDLVQLAHIALALIGEGDVRFEGKIQKSGDVLRKLNVEPHKLQIKEGLALINGTSVMAGIASLNIIHAERVLCAAVKNGAMALESVQAFSDSLDQRLHDLRPHEGQSIIARTLRNMTVNSKLLRSRKILKNHDEFKDEIHELPESVQEFYSIRCIPQILGPVYDTIKKCLKEVSVEINSVTDNPVIDADNDEIYHGGNFHGDYIAAAMDQLKMVIVKLILLSERRINFFLNRNVNKSFSPFLNLEKPGLTMGLQGIQFVATSTAAQSQTLAFPQYVHSIPTNGDNQDIVSMGTDAALLTAKVIENAYVEIVIEQVTLAQAVDYLDETEKLSDDASRLYKDIRSIVPKITEDRPLTSEMEKLIEHLKESSAFKIKW